jgi:cobalt-zinc-cadmium efflux system outer membrane protein
VFTSQIPRSVGPLWPTARRPLGPVLLAGLLCFGMASAQSASGPASHPSAPPGELALSLPLALSRALASGPDLVRAQNELRSIEARRAGAALWFPSNPYASLLFGPRRERQADGSTLGSLQLQVHVEQSFEIAGQRWTRLDAVAAASAAQRDQAEYARRSVEAAVKSLYASCLLSAQRAQVAIEREAIARQLLESARIRVQLGAAGELETNLAQIEVGRVLGERRDIEVEREGRLAELRIFINLPPTVPMVLTSSEMTGHPGLRPTELGLADLIERAYQARADLRALYKQKGALRAEDRRLIREIVPNPLLSFDWQKDLDGQEFVGGTVGLALPLWNRNQGGRALLAAAERNRQLEQQLLITRIAAEVGQTLATLQLRHSQVEAFTRDALPPAQRNVELLRRGWQAGKFDLFRVITALRELAEVRTRYLLMLEQLWIAAISLERAVGESLFTATSASASPSPSLAPQGAP